MKQVFLRCTNRSAAIITILALLFLVFILSGCKGPADTAESLTAETTLSYDDFLSQIETILNQDLPSTAITYQWLQENASCLTDHAEAAALFCCQDLLSKGSEAIRISSYYPEGDPSPTTELECRIVQCLAEEAGDNPIPSNPDPVSWFTGFHFSTVDQYDHLGKEISHSYYNDHPFQKQHMIAVLRDPEWRLPSATMLDGELTDEAIYVDAINSFWDLFESGTLNPLIHISPSDANLADLCTENTVWVISQAENGDVTLQITASEDTAVRIIYSP